MAWVPGGKVIAKVIGLPAFLASSTIGFNCCGVRTPLAFKSFSKVIAWPLWLISNGIIIGFTGEPSSPMVDEKRHAEQHMGCLVFADR